MVKKSELEREPLTGLTILCIQQGLDPTGDKETLIARLSEPEDTGEGGEGSEPAEPGESAEPAE